MFGSSFAMYYLVFYVAITSLNKIKLVALFCVIAVVWL